MLLPATAKLGWVLNWDIWLRVIFIFRLRAASFYCFIAYSLMLYFLFQFHGDDLPAFQVCFWMICFDFFIRLALLLIFFYRFAINCAISRGCPSTHPHTPSGSISGCYQNWLRFACDWGRTYCHRFWWEFWIYLGAVAINSQPLRYGVTFVPNPTILSLASIFPWEDTKPPPQ